MITPENGCAPGPQSQQLIDTIDEELSKDPEEERTPECRRKVFTEIFGEESNGRVRTMGSGVTPTDVYGPILRTRAGRASTNVVELQERIAYLEKKDAKRNEELARNKKRTNAMWSFIQTTFQMMGYEVPNFDVETPSSSMGQVATGGSRYSQDDVMRGEDHGIIGDDDMTGEDDMLDEDDTREDMLEDLYGEDEYDDDRLGEDAYDEDELD